MEHFEIRDNFYGDGKPIKIISGAFHYFRTVPEYWRDRLEKLKAMNPLDRYNNSVNHPDEYKELYGGNE